MINNGLGFEERGVMLRGLFVESADVLEDELEDRFEAGGVELQRKDGFEVEGALNLLEHHSRLMLV